MRTVWTFHTAGSLVFGRDAVQQLDQVAARLEARRLLIVTDKVLAAAGLVERVSKPLTAAGVDVDVFDGGVAEPPVEVADACIQQANAFAPDALLGLGGGSNMDLAKVTATVLAHGGNPLDYGGDGKIPGPVKPLICVPTTSGTGSEVSGAAVLTDPETAMKIGILSNFIRPHAAVVDPLMTVSCPPKVTADSGIDALTHAIEAYTAVDNETFPLAPGEQSVYQGRNPFASLVAERAIELVGQFLRRAVQDGNDLEAREGMSLAAVFGGLAFSNAGVALVHALEYPVGVATHCSHGAGNGLLLPFVMQYNLPRRVPQFARIAALLGEDVTGLSTEDAAQRAIEAVAQLKRDIGIPERLRDLGAQLEHLPGWAKKAFAVKRILRVNPRVPTLEDLEGILAAAY